MSAPNSTDSESEKPRSVLTQMCVRGANYTEEYEFEMFGEEVTVVLGPLKDKKFLPIAGFLKAHLDMDEEEAVEAVEKAKEQAEEEGEESIDISLMDEEFVVAMQKAAVYGLRGAHDEDGNVVDYTEDEAQELVDMMVGGFSVEIGGKVMEISGDVRDATKFRGTRGSV